MWLYLSHNVIARRVRGLCGIYLSHDVIARRVRDLCGIYVSHNVIARRIRGQCGYTYHIMSLHGEFVACVAILIT